MGLTSTDIAKNLNVLSGGEITKVLMAKLLLGHYNILLLDEPTNFLDIYSVEALEQMMKGYAGTIVFVTHDRQLIDNVADIVLEIKDQRLIEWDRRNPDTGREEA
jgi:macrolide transport system ATP-binding/permease protein